MTSRNFFTVSSIAVALAVLSLAAAHAQDADKAKRKAERKQIIAEADKDFHAADKNNDGAVSKAELAAAPAKDLPHLRKYFDQMDTNKDGKVTIAERNAFVRAHPELKKGDDKKKGK